MLPKLALFSLSLHNSKTGHSHPSIGYYKAKILDISFRESSHNTLEIARPRITGTTNTGTTADSDSRSFEVRRHSTLELESHITRPGHPQQTGNRPNNGTSLRQINAFTAAYLMLLSNKFLIVRQMAIDANHRFPTAHPRYLLLSGLRVQYFESIFTAFRTSRPHLLLFGLRVHIYCFSDFAFTFTAFWTPIPRTSRPHLLLSTGFALVILLLSMGFGLALYSFPRASASHFTASTDFGLVILQLSTGFGLALTAFHGLRPSILLLSTGFGLVILLLSTGFGLALYSFPRASASHFIAFHGLRPSNFTAFHGFRPRTYSFPRASTSHFTTFHGLRPRTLQLSTGFGLALYCFPRASPWYFTTFHGPRPEDFRPKLGTLFTIEKSEANVRAQSHE
ncbi:hypothetical protein CRG98_005492 [Punica granatum]|uniref:Uncharacterized protein n=1 Tax=Punica granatum TaxID=22663 RepID=A0A2I0L0I2_PUNGR|nr:hypothetical protein CRG98_005492 [Punica granatum]